MKSENIYNSDKTQRSCPHGSSVTYPVGTISHVKVGDENCTLCPCYHWENGIKTNDETSQAILCCYPNFSPKYGIDDNKT